MTVKKTIKKRKSGKNKSNQRLVKKKLKVSSSPVELQLKDRLYEIQIGAGIVSKLEQFLKKHPDRFASRRAFVISDVSLTQARSALQNALTRAGWEFHEFPVQAGEGLKELSSVIPLYGELMKARAGRDSVIFALGGGSVGDAVGFVAATYLRGVAWVGVPTTLLAQVDSSVGGKTGVNHPQGKNLIGSFHQPGLVICDTDFLKTLNTREMISGFGEILKYGIAFDPQFYRFLEENQEAILNRDPDVLQKCIRVSLQWKAKMVVQDEWDRKGIREVLNLGHTFGHALEGITRYETYQHGEAVIWGLRFMLALSQVRRKLSASVSMKIDVLLARFPVPSLPADLSSDRLLEFMNQDKKVRQGRIHFVLLSRLGKTVSDSHVTEQDIRDAHEILNQRISGERSNG